jgi:hypothetical protein
VGFSLVEARKGDELPEIPFDFSEDWVTGYVAAVDDETSAWSPGNEPVLALDTAALGALLKTIDLPGGTLHVAQQLSGRIYTELDDERFVTARIASRGERKGWVLMRIDWDVEDGTRAPILSGTTTITFPMPS